MNKLCMEISERI